MTPFPASFPVDATSVMVEQFRAGFSDKAAASNAAWNVLGYGLKVGLGDPTSLIRGAGVGSSEEPMIVGSIEHDDIAPCSDVEAEETLSALEASLNSPPHIRGASPIPIKKILQLALKIILMVAAA